MNDPTMLFSENPLYEKLYHRFSYGGKTVGEMMRTRAREAAANAGRERTELNELTAESCITRANFLPREEAAALPSYGTATAVALPRRLSPTAVLALLLMTFVLSFLLISGIRHSSFSEGLLAAEGGGEALYVSQLDSELAL